MGCGDREFEQNIDEVLKANGLRFKGIRLKCRQCGEPGLAGSVSLAGTFGWIELRQISGPDYEGLCMRCGKGKV
jgi:hypothetical protein